MSNYLKVYVHSNASKEKVEKTGEDRFEIHVKEPAEGNIANTRVLEILKSLFPNKKIRIINGHHSPRKLISIDI